MKKKDNELLIIAIIVGLIIILTNNDFARTANIRTTGGTYHSSDEVYNLLKDMASSHPGKMSYEIIGKSIQGKDILLFAAGNLALCSPNEQGKFMFDGRVHGPEDCGTENGIEFIRWALDSNDADAIRVRNNNCLLFIPIINIDTLKRQNMRRNYTAEEGGPLNVPYGVDLNRNAPTGFGGSGNASPLNNYEYRGISGGSEPETKAYMNAMNKYKPNVYMNVHCGMQILQYRQNTAITQKIISLITNISNARGANTNNYYPPGQGCGGGMVCAEGNIYGSGWIHETSKWETLSPTLEEYLSVWYPRAFPIYLAMAQAIENPNSQPPQSDTVIYTLPNGGFEQGTSGWDIRHGYSLDTTTYHSGSTSVKSVSTFYNPTIDPTKGDARAIWNIPAIPIQEGQKIFVSGYIKTTYADCLDGLRIGIDLKNNSGGSAIIGGFNDEWVSWGSDWTYVSFNITVKPWSITNTGKITKANLWLQGRPYNCSAVGWFDDIKLYIIQSINNTTPPINNTNNTVCTMEAKICPDGSYVSRILPNCEFQDCPTEVIGRFDPVKWIKEQWQTQTGKILMIIAAIFLLYVLVEAGPNRGFVQRSGRKRR
jgi:hypothetical protein